MYQELLSNKWDLVDPAIKKHYGIKEGEKSRLKGVLAVKHGTFFKLLMPFIRLTGALVPVEGDDFAVTVENKVIDNTFYWHRWFTKNNKTYEFKSKMQLYKGDVIEIVGFNIGIRMGVDVIDGAIVYEDKGYIIKLGSLIVPIPLRLFMGKSDIKEFTDKNTPHDLEMDFVVNHPLFGFGFSYKGYFNFTK